MYYYDKPSEFYIIFTKYQTIFESNIRDTIKDYVQVEIHIIVDNEFKSLIRHNIGGSSLDQRMVP
jgi:hypothetical protein